MIRLSLINTLIICLSLTACSPKPEKQVAEIVIDNSNIQDSVDVSAFVDHVDIKKLSEQPGHYIAEATKIIAQANGNYIIFDSQSGKINVFNANGAFVKTVSKVGDGKNDPLNILDFIVNKHNGIEVYDFAQMKLFVYDSLYNFQKVVRSKDFNHFNSIAQLPYKDVYVAYSTFKFPNRKFHNQSFRVAYLQNNLGMFKAEQVFDEKYRGFQWLSYSDHFPLMTDSLRFIQAFDNTTYSVQPSGLIPRYRIRYAKNNLPEDLTAIMDDESATFKKVQLADPSEITKLFSAFAKRYSTWLENDKYIYVSSQDAGTGPNTFFYSLISKKDNSVLSSGRVLNIKSSRIVLPPLRYYDIYRHQFLTVITGAKLKELLSPDEYNQFEIENRSDILYLLKVNLK